MTPTRRSLVMVGELPEPFGGVALHCYHACTELARLGVDVHLLDSAPGRVKDLPPLAHYSRVTGRYVRGGFSALRSPRVVRSWFVLVFPVAHRIGLRPSLLALVLSHRTYATARLAGTRSIVAHHAGTGGLAALVAARALDAQVTLFVYGAEWCTRRGTGNFPISSRQGSSDHRLFLVYQAALYGCHRADRHCSAFAGCRSRPIPSLLPHYGTPGRSNCALRRRDAPPQGRRRARQGHLFAERPSGPLHIRRALRPLEQESAPSSPAPALKIGSTFAGNSAPTSFLVCSPRPTYSSSQQSGERKVSGWSPPRPWLVECPLWPVASLRYPK